ncbi:MAG: M20/M25/M40 family metallo-hydrolase [Sphaerochaetaceae bacterium]
MILPSFIVILSIIVTLLSTAFIRTIIIRHTAASKLQESYEIPSDIPLEDAAENLAEAVSFKTVASEKENFPPFHKFLSEHYPLVHSKLSRMYSDTDNLVFVYEGKDPSLPPALLTAHQDVVPADEGEWEHPPFEAVIDDDGYIYGRGSFDDKSSLIAILESVEYLLKQNFVPKRTWYIAFGCDEETRGSDGASLIASRFEEDGIRFGFLLDEGGVVAKGFIGQIKAPIAVVGVCEKGNAHVSMEVSLIGGHSSTPKNPTSMGILAKAVSQIEHHPQSPRLIAPVKQMLHHLGLHAPFSFAYIVLNSWLFAPIIISIFKKNPTMNALIRSTTTVTMVKGSEAANIIPTTSYGIMNIRMLPGEKAATVIDSITKDLKDDRVRFTVEYESPVSSVSPIDTKGFAHLKNTISTIFPECVVSPYVMTGGSDALHYEKVCDNVYRFTPALMDNSELDRMHNTNERFSKENLSNAILFYTTLIRNDSF